MQGEAFRDMKITTNRIIREIHRKAYLMGLKRNELIHRIVTEAYKPKPFKYVEYNSRKPLWADIKDNVRGMEEACNKLIARIQQEDILPKKMIKALVYMKKARMAFRAIYFGKEKGS
jgi:hypothetical protein